LVAEGWIDGTVELWDVMGGGVRKLGRHRGEVSGVAFSPDGRWVVSAGWEDAAIKIWNVATGQEDKTLAWRDPQQRIAISEPLQQHPATQRNK
jgi:WD40 repeat protein